MTWKELLAVAEAAGVQPDDKVGFIHIYPLAARQPTAEELEAVRDEGWIEISVKWQPGVVNGHMFMHPNSDRKKPS